MPLHVPTASSSSRAQEVWTTAFNELSQRVRPYFVRQEPYHRALAYVQGLMGPVERKNGWQVAEEVGEATPYAMQHLLDRAKWDCDGVRDELHTYILETLAAPHAVVVIDETGFLKKGHKSVGVQRQYSGTAGRIENCQVGVFLSYASSHGHTLLDRELYPPKSRADDQERCREAHVPEEVTFATKPELALRMLERTLDSGLPVAWVAGDTVYGSSQPLRAGLEARKQAYALAVACKEQVDVQGTRRRVDQVAHDIAKQDWQELSAGAGSKGPRLFAWARIELAAPETSGWQHWLLVRRSLDEGAKPAEMAYVLIFAPTGTSLEEMVKAFGARWTVEQCFEEGKGEVGLDEYARSLLARLVSVRNSFNACHGLFSGIASQRGKRRTQKKSEQTLQSPEPEATDPAQTQASSDLPVMIPLSIAEIRRLFFRLVGTNSSFSFAYYLAGRAGDALIKLLRGSAITNVEALSSVIYNCRTSSDKP